MGWIMEGSKVEKVGLEGSRMNKVRLELGRE